MRGWFPSARSESEFKYPTLAALLGLLWSDEVRVRLTSLLLAALGQMSSTTANAKLMTAWPLPVDNSHILDPSLKLGKGGLAVDFTLSSPKNNW